jgi:hypothetical protein
VHLAIEGIPPHAWDVSTVEHLLGTAAAIDELAQESASRADLGIFRVSAWAREVDSILTARLLWVPKPEDGIPPGPQPSRRLRELGMLEYKVLIHVSRVEEFMAAAGPSGARGSLDCDNSGRSCYGGQEEGFWTSRSVPWAAGVEDSRGSMAGADAGVEGGGAAGGRRAATPATP